MSNSYITFYIPALRNNELPEEDREAIQEMLDDHNGKARTQRVALKAAISTWSCNAVSSLTSFHFSQRG